MRHPLFAANEVLALAPMAGRGLRLGLETSKELVALSGVAQSQEHRPTVLSEVMLRRMLAAGIREAVLTIADHKLDVRDHYGESYTVQARAECTESLKLSYVFANDSPNTPTSIDAGYALTRGRVCALGFADILFHPCPGYSRALNELAKGKADVVLGLFPTSQVMSVDMVAFSPDGRVTDILIKQVAGARLAYTWSLAVWRPQFTEFLHSWLAMAARNSRAVPPTEHYVGDVLIAAMNAGLRVDALVVSGRASIDAGTPESLALARQIDW